jgi:DNA/RNA endonuclease YhcR with UshA esterase domain
MKYVPNKSFLAKQELPIAIITSAILGAIVISLGWVLTGTETPLESVLLQLLQIILTLVATILPTRVLIQRQEKSISQNRARMALRRTITLDGQMRQVSKYISSQQAKIESLDNDGNIPSDIAIDSIKSIEAMHNMQYGQIQAVAEDWGDIIPEEITEQGGTEDDRN